MSRRFYRQSGPPIKKTRLNHEIRLSPVNLVNERNERVGIIDTRDALRMAQEAGLDLVEIQPDSRPPLCKIMDYGKYKYELSKKRQGAKQKSQEIKEVRLGRSAKIDEHDVEIRVQQARRFIMLGHKVQFVQRFRGREMAFQGIGLDRLREIAADLEDIAKVEAPPRTMGRQMSMTVAPDKPKVEALKRKLEAEKEARRATMSAEEIEAEEAAEAKAAEEQDKALAAADAQDDEPQDDAKLTKKQQKAKAKAEREAAAEDDPTLLAETPADLLD